MYDLLSRQPSKLLPVCRPTCRQAQSELARHKVVNALTQKRILPQILQVRSGDDGHNALARSALAIKAYNILAGLTEEKCNFCIFLRTSWLRGMEDLNGAQCVQFT